jgi:hypothetical protein
MIELMKMNHFQDHSQASDEDEKETYLQIDLKIKSSNQRSNHHISMKISNRMHISTLSSSSTH